MTFQAQLGRENVISGHFPLQNDVLVHVPHRQDAGEELTTRVFDFGITRPVILLN
jgi:hypothetical protein